LPIIVFTSGEKVQRQLSLTWRVHELLAKPSDSTEAIFLEAGKSVSRMGISEKGDVIVIVAGDPKGLSGRTDLFKIHPVS